MTAYSRTFRRYCRADKAADRRMFWLMVHYNLSPGEAGRDAYVVAFRREAGRLWHRLPATVRAAVLNPDREE